MALTSGPTQPEFSSFEPVATTDMVNEFGGDFTYNLPVLEIPGPEGSSYPLSLSYHSGTTPEDESSWVGYGWTLNPGAINRSKRGFPDDWDGESVTFYNKTRPNTTFSLTASATLELYSLLGLNAGGTVRLNNYTGFATSQTFGLAFAGVSLGYTYGGGDGSFSLQINPVAMVNAASKMKKKADVAPSQDDLMGPPLPPDMEKDKQKAEGAARLKDKKKGRRGTRASYSTYSVNSHVWPDAVAEHTGASVAISMGGIGTPSQAQIGIGGALSGTINWQKNKSEKSELVYGYMFSDHAVRETSPRPMRGSVQTGMMDYYVEKGGMYSKRDMFIGIPFTNADQFAVSGEGIGGGFRAYNKKIGAFSPNYARSTTLNLAVGIEAELGLNMGGGATISGGDNEMSVSSWPTYEEMPAGFKDWKYFEDLNYDGTPGSGEHLDYQSSVMRFTNDLGGAVLYDGNITEPFRASNTAPSTHVTNNLEMRLNKGGGVPSELQDRTVGRSSYIGYTLVKDINTPIGEHGPDNNAVHYRSYQYGDAIDDGGLSDSQIGEFSVVNSDGMRYTYGLPLTNKNEKSISHDIVNSDYNGATGIRTRPAPSNPNNPLDPNRYRTKVGQEANAEYASAYLLTAITTPDYIDRNSDGFTSDDFGGYTAFRYTDSYEYHWRLPYQGLDHMWNSVSDPKDDLGTYSSGDKQIRYVQTIETKTHYAAFKLGERLDGVEADDDATAMASTTAVGQKKLKKLKRIELWSKGNDLLMETEDDVLIKVIHFDYSYESWTDTPNSIENSAEGNPNRGRLTLKKVWFEHQGIVKARIAPYEFEYTYPQVQYPSPYGSSIAPATGLEEDPSYSPGLDAWGNYQKDGKVKKLKNLAWVDQSPEPDFDPAAWQLKQIRLPSGGEIHVQYEQDDYGYVQDQEAHAMVPISSASGGNQSRANDDSEFILDLSVLHKPIEYSEQEFAQAIVEKLLSIYGPGATERKKIFFKHLFRLIGTDGIPNPVSQPPWFNDCSMDYVTGYCRLIDAEKVPNGTGGFNVKISLKPAEPNGGVTNHLLPGDVCLDFVTTQREGMLDFNGCDVSDNNSLFPEEPEEYGELFMNFMQSLTAISTNASAELFYCLRRCDELSYFRIPVVTKLGGGTRVKRLLMYDRGMQINASTDEREPAVVYGTEYIYKVFDEQQRRVISSGVAAAEPASIRDECALMQPLPRGGQTWLDRVISGKDRKQMEGPLGESILPSASVGYSQVISKNIHSGQTDVGFKVSNFLTAKDYPMKVQYTPLSSDPYIPIDITTGFFNMNLLLAWLSQGFSFERFDSYYGKSTSVRNYSGDYEALLPSDNQSAPFNASLISSVQHDYFEPEEQLPVFKGFGNENGNVSVITTDLPLGKEMDMAIESKVVMENYKGISTEFDIDFGLLTMLPVIIPQGSGSGSVSISSSTRRSIATSKIINYPAVLKKTTAKKDQFTSSVENLAFDGNTGEPLITQTNDEYNGVEIGGPNQSHEGLYTTYSVPAGMHYGAMNQIAENERTWITTSLPGVSSLDCQSDNEANTCALDFSGSNLCDALSALSPGTLVEIHDATALDGQGTVGHVAGITGNTVNVLPTSYNPEWITGPAAIHVLRSANTNILGETVGEFTTYGNGDIQGTYIPLNSTTDPNYQAKLDFVSALNTALEGGDEADAGNLEFASSAGCFTLDGPVTIETEGNYATIIVPGSTVPGTPSGNLITNGGFSGNCLDPSDISCAILNEYFLSGNSDCVNDWEVAAGIPVITEWQGHYGNTLFLGHRGFSGYHSSAYQVLDISLGEGDFSLNMKMAFEEDSGTPFEVLRIYLYDSDEVLSEFPLPINSSLPIPGRSIYSEPFGEPLQNGCQTSFAPYSFDFHLDEQEAGQYDMLLIAYGHKGGVHIDDVELTGGTPPIIIPPCEQDILVFNGNEVGEFVLNNQTGLIEYHEPGNDCFPIELTCFQFCDEAYPKTVIDNVVTSSASEISDNWSYNPDLYGGLVEDNNVYQNGSKGKWRTSASSGYSSPVTGLDGNPIYNHAAGIYSMDLYNWSHPSANDPTKWLTASRMTEYSPNGNLLEEQNILGIKSCAKYGYSQMMPVMVAQNASGNSVMFESFENVYGTPGDLTWEDGIPAFAGPVVSDFTSSALNNPSNPVRAHTGVKAITLDSEGFLPLHKFELDQTLVNNSLTCKVWVHAMSLSGSNSNDLTPTGVQIDDNQEPLKFQIKEIGLSTPMEETGFRRVAEVGQWALYTATIDLSSLNQSPNASYQAYIENKTLRDIGLDDVLIYPSDASVNTYVYDPTNLRLVASMDDQHFGLLYQYNAEGKLIRKMKETERGVKTVQETYYNTPLNTLRPTTVY